MRLFSYPSMVLIWLLLPFFLIFAVNIQAHADEKTPRFSVQGTGIVHKTPDVAFFTASVRSEAKTAKDALRANTQKMKDVFAALKLQNIAPKDMQTHQFSIQPQIIYPDGKRREPPQTVGYSVSNQLSLRIYDLSKLGALMDEIVQLGINEGGNLFFGFDDPAPLKQEALGKAIDHAKEKATFMAARAGFKLGKIISISEGGHPSPQPLRMSRMAMDKAESAVPIPRGESSLSSQVTLTYEILEE